MASILATETASSGASRNRFHLLYDGWQEWTCVVSRIADSRPGNSSFSLQLRSDMGADSTSEFMVEAPDESVEMHFGCVDQRIAVNVAGSEVFSIPFHSSSATRAMVPQPVWIRSATGSAIIHRLVVRRDLHYVPNAIDEVPTATVWQLQAGQYFVLGDYSPVSIDSRSLKIGAVVESEIVGTVSQRR